MDELLLLPSKYALLLLTATTKHNGDGGWLAAQKPRMNLSQVNKHIVLLLSSASLRATHKTLYFTLDSPGTTTSNTSVRQVQYQRNGSEGALDVVIWIGRKEFLTFSRFLSGLRIDIAPTAPTHMQTGDRPTYVFEGGPTGIYIFLFCFRRTLLFQLQSQMFADFLFVRF